MHHRQKQRPICQGQALSQRILSPLSDEDSIRTQIDRYAPALGIFTVDLIF